MKEVNINELINFSAFDINWDKVFGVPEFAKLKECEQNPKWHGEGNVFIHTMLVCEQAKTMCLKMPAAAAYEAKVLITAALFHDIGKGVTTTFNKGAFHAYGHEFAGEKIARRLLWNEELRFREDVCALIRHHMDGREVMDKKDCLERIVEMSKDIPSWELLIDLMLCDSLGSWPKDGNRHAIDENLLYNLKYSFCQPLGCLHKKSEIPPAQKLYQVINDFNEKRQILVYVYIGLPGSGKSTRAKKFSEDLATVGLDIITVSRDSIRAELGYCQDGEKIVGTDEQENAVSEEFNRQVLDAVKAGKDVIIDNINLKRKYREALKLLLQGYNIRWNYVYFEAQGGLSENIKRRDGQISGDVFDNMILNFDWPTVNEYHSLDIRNN